MLLVSGGGDQALVLMTPHHQVQEVMQELLRNVVSWSVFTPGKTQIVTSKQDADSIMYI